MRVGLAYGGFRTNFRFVCQQEVQLIKADKFSLQAYALVLYEINY